jgi:hypothetical protein
MLATQGEAARWIEQAKVWLSERDTNTAHFFILEPRRDKPQ